jgi:hypothetical protein
MSVSRPSLLSAPTSGALLLGTAAPARPTSVYASHFVQVCDGGPVISDRPYHVRAGDLWFGMNLGADGASRNTKRDSTASWTGISGWV